MHQWLLQWQHALSSLLHRCDLRFAHMGKAAQTPQASTEKQGLHYIRTGACHSCGQCCSNIHLVSGLATVQDAEQLERLKVSIPEYRYFTPVEQTEDGVAVKCIHLLPNKRCAIYEHRPQFCRDYPSELGMRLGAKLAPECGYAFKPKRSFQSVLNQINQQNLTRPKLTFVQRVAQFLKKP
ncbi:MAG: YkgJ family cysteine cluster protein [Vampirovibrionales bacterium]|nr:YkgJ family cysteine cluster protein [Vampirovibrionales bacterium]